MWDFQQSYVAIPLNMLCRDFPQSYVVIPLTVATSNLFHNFLSLGSLIIFKINNFLNTLVHIVGNSGGQGGMRTRKQSETTTFEDLE